MNTSLYYVSLLIITKIYFSHKFQINFFVIFCNKCFATDKYIYKHPKAYINDTKQSLKDSDLSGVG